MSLKILVSGVFYDLRYIKEDLANFIKIHDFKPIIVDKETINNMPKCHVDMTILIVGGEYEESNIIYKKLKENSSETLSLPIYCFVDENVFFEYKIYKLNKNNIDNDRNYMRFKSVNDVNVFRFIDDLYKMKLITIKSFKKSEEIKNFMSNKWADMIKKYILLLRYEEFPPRNISYIEREFEQFILNDKGEELNLYMKPNHTYVSMKNTDRINDYILIQVEKLLKYTSDDIFVLVDDSNRELWKKYMKEKNLNQQLKLIELNENLIEQCWNEKFIEETLFINENSDKQSYFFINMCSIEDKYKPVIQRYLRSGRKYGLSLVCIRHIV